jgi:hypothetical protein
MRPRSNVISDHAALACRVPRITVYDVKVILAAQLCTRFAVCLFSVTDVPRTLSELHRELAGPHTIRILKIAIEFAQIRHIKSPKVLMDSSAAA